MTSIIYDPELNKFSYKVKELDLQNQNQKEVADNDGVVVEKGYPKKVKSDELDKLKDLHKKIEEYNRRSDYFYKLNLIFGVKRGWS